MSLQQLATIITQLALIVIGVLTIVDWARHPHKARRDVAILFGELALIAAAQILATVPGSAAYWFGLAASLLLMAHPYLLLRLVPHFRPVPSAVETAALVGMLASWAGLVLFPAPLPIWLTLILVAYFAYVEGYATWAFVRGARNTTGVTHWRLLLAALGSGFVALVIVLAGLIAAVPSARSLSILSQVVSALSILSYYFAFATPGWLRRLWQLGELQHFLQDGVGNWAERSEAEMLARLCEAATRSVGGLAAVVALADAKEKLRIRAATDPTILKQDRILEGPISRRAFSEQARLVAEPPEFGQEEADIAARAGAKAILVSPITMPTRAWGVLLVFTRQVPLFTSDDLALLNLLCEQTAIALSYAQSITESRTSEQELRALFRAMTDIIFVVDGQGQFLRMAPTSPISPAVSKNWVNQSIQQVFPPDQARILLTYIQLALTTHQPIKVEYGSGNDGPNSWFAASISPIGNDRVLWVARDMTERRQAEEALRHYTQRLEGIREVDRAILAAESPQEVARTALARLRQLVPSYRAGVVFFDWDKEQVQFLAVETDDADTPTTGDSIPLEDFSPPEMMRERKIPVYFEDTTRITAPSPFLARLIERGIRSALFTPFVVEGRLIGALNIFSLEPSAFSQEHQEIAREVASQLAVTLQQARLREQLRLHAAELEERVAERTAELEYANKELEAFSYSVSHDLRAPLRAVASFAQLLQQDYQTALDENGIYYLELVRDNAAEMSKLIDSLLSFSRTSREELKKERVAPLGLVQQVIETLSPDIQGRNVDWMIEAMPECDADPRLLKLVWMNLLSNAVKFTRAREVARIQVGYCVRQGQGAFFVRDNGVGFDMESADKLFGVFQRFHHQDEYEGTGVGLAIVQRIIRRHGGRIWAEAKPDQGATFYFTLGTKGAG